MTRYGVAVIAPNENGITGVVHFLDKGGVLHIDYDLKGLSDGKHGFHIHEYGDLTDGCESACSHFNPYGVTHGGLDSKVRHLGDLGNIESKNKVAKGRFSTNTLSLNPKKINCVIGRMIIVHADPDDLGLGGLGEDGKVVDEKVHEESLKTGNAGKRLGCGVIGYAEPPKEVKRAAYQPTQSMKDYDARSLTHSNTVTGDFTTDSLKFGYGVRQAESFASRVPTWGWVATGVAFLGFCVGLKR